MSQSSVTLAGKPYELKVPSSFIAREALDTEFRRVASSNDLRDDPVWGSLIWAALVGVYIPDLLPQGLTLKAHKWSAPSFGEAVYEHLREQGATTAEIVSAGLEALKLNRQSLAPREHEVAEVAGNS
ncbi:MAG: hypothetical protein E6Q97_38115 [Desulfurellales bacterium]|nr:MAG: hypothetical protein E6Q97_38115 [Desulfurellales bacterium]